MCLADSLNSPQSVIYKSALSDPGLFHVFISSDTDEFKKIRQDLEEIINSVELVNSRRVEELGDHRGVFARRVMTAEVVESDRGTTIGGDIRKALDRSHIYIGIFGKEFSKPTIAEFRYARSLGLHTLIYYFTRPPKIGSKLFDPARGIKNPVTEFLVTEVKSRGLRIRGNYRKISLNTAEDLENEIVADLAWLMSEMVRESAAIRRIVLQTLEA
jgi:hypothetical protein